MEKGSSHFGKPRLFRDLAEELQCSFRDEGLIATIVTDVRISDDRDNVALLSLRGFFYFFISIQEHLHKSGGGISVKGSVW